MATVQGMCKNCGSLIVFDDMNEKCECIFCNCVFDSVEALKIIENPQEYSFPNEVIAKDPNTKSNLFSNPVYVNPITNDAVRANTNKGGDSHILNKKSEYEISPNDVKAPKKSVIIVSASALAVILLVVVISLPLYFSREKLSSYMKDNMKSVFENLAEVDCSMDENGNTLGYVMSGYRCQNVSVVTDDSLEEANVISILDSYSSLREGKLKNGKKSDIEMRIYCDGGYYIAGYSKDGNPNIEFIKDEA